MSIYYLLHTVEGVGPADDTRWRVQVAEKRVHHIRTARGNRIYQGNLVKVCLMVTHSDIVRNSKISYDYIICMFIVCYIHIFMYNVLISYYVRYFISSNNI